MEQSDYPRVGRGVVLMVLSAVCAAVGQLLWKMSADAGWGALAAGTALYGIGAFVMVLAYRYGPLSTLQPILGLGYVLSLVLGALWLTEEISAGRVLGVLVVVVGVWLVAGDAKRADALRDEVARHE